MFDANSWLRTESHLDDLPGSAGLSARVRDGKPPWPEIGMAMSHCTWFPSAEFRALFVSGDFDVRWPLTFAAWYWGASGASVDQACADFLTGAGLLEQALTVLPEFNGPEWLSAWREGFGHRFGGTRCDKFGIRLYGEGSL
jgi:hypothetical protein